jgi:hypothetical protein
VATDRMAMISELTAMANLDCMVKPSILPPWPMVMLRRAWAQKSMIQPISTFLGSNVEPPEAAWPAARRCSWRSCCIREVSATMARLWAFMMALMSPVSPREKRGQRDALGQPAAGRRTLDVHGRTAGRLADGADHRACPVCPGPGPDPWRRWICPRPAGWG